MHTSGAAYDLFISYAEADRAWVEGHLLDVLAQAGVRYVTESAFELGAPRLTEFEHAVQSSRRTVLVLSPAYMADDLARFTDLLAQSYGLDTATWPVIPLLLQPVQLPPRLAMLTSLDAIDPDGWAEAEARLLRDLQRPVPGAAPRPPCPYPGMAPFTEEDSRRFFGREREIGELTERLRLYPFLTVIGASGSGKSSLVFAGLVPALKKSGLFGPGEPWPEGSPWLTVSLRPGDAPLAGLAAALRPNSAQREVELGNPAGAVAALLAGQPTPGTPERRARRVLLIVDQFEEVFALAAREATNRVYRTSRASLNAC